jgi:hypothetical protein
VIMNVSKFAMYIATIHAPYEHFRTQFTCIYKPNLQHLYPITPEAHKNNASHHIDSLLSALGLVPSVGAKKLAPLSVGVIALLRSTGLHSIPGAGNPAIAASSLALCLPTPPPPSPSPNPSSSVTNLTPAVLCRSLSLSTLFPSAFFFSNSIISVLKYASAAGVAE